jgi:hypothetical protein
MLYEKPNTREDWMTIAHVYIMTSESCPNSCKIGFHTTSNTQREREVRNGTGEIWKIVAFIRFDEPGEKAALLAETCSTLVKTRFWSFWKMRVAASGQNGGSLERSVKEVWNELKRSAFVLCNDTNSTYPYFREP